MLSLQELGHRLDHHVPEIKLVKPHSIPLPAKAPLKLGKHRTALLLRGKRADFFQEPVGVLDVSPVEIEMGL